MAIENKITIVKIITGIEKAKIKAFEEENQIRIPYEISKRRKGDMAISFADATKAKKELNWEPSIQLEKGLLKTIEYFKLLLK